MSKLYDKKKDIILVLLVWVLCFLYVLPIILANRCYYDDTQRVLYHNAGWTLDGRPLTELFLKIVCGAQNFVYDVFPLPLLLSITLFAFVSVLWTRKFYSIGNGLGVIVSFLPISMPFFLTNLSYRFDCIGFMSSIVLLMIPFLIETDLKWRRLTIDSVFVLLSMCFYQPSVGLFIGLSLFLLFIDYIERKAFIINAVIDGVATIISTLIYKVVIAGVFVDKQGWRAEANGFISSSSPIRQIIINIGDVAALIVDYCKGAGARQLLIYGLIWIAGGIVALVMFKEKSTLQRALLVLFYGILPPVLFIVSVLPMSVLTVSYPQPWHQPELMIMMFIPALSIVLLGKKYYRISIVAGVLLIFFQMSFSYAYGNALRNQKEYEEYIVHSIVSDIETSQNDIDEIVVRGKMPFSPIVRNMVDIMPIMDDMIPTGVDDDGLLCGAIINHYSSIHLGFNDLLEEDIAYLSSTEPAYKRVVYDMFIKDNRVYVDFRNGD